MVRRVQVGALARHVTVDPAGRRLWISLGSSASSIAVVDISDAIRPRVLRTIHPPFLVHDVGFSPSGKRVWVTAGRERKLAIYRADGQGPLRLLPADAAPQHITFGPSMAYVASGEGRSLHTHSLTDGRLLRAARIPIGSYNVQRGPVSSLHTLLNTRSLAPLYARPRVRLGARVVEVVYVAWAGFYPRPGLGARQVYGPSRGGGRGQTAPL